MTRLFRRLFGRASTSRKPVHKLAGFRPLLEALEDRVVPANFITIIAGGTTLLSNPGLSSFTDTGTYSIDPSQFTPGAGNVTLLANNDITISNTLPPLASGQSLTFRAGRNLDLGGDITAGDSTLSFTANDPGANQAQRIAGDATFTDTAQVISDVSGSVTFTGGAGDSTTTNTHPNCPILINGGGVGGTVSASGGITMTARGNATNPNGIDVFNGATLNSTGGNSIGGNISLNGVGFNGSGTIGGIQVQGGSTVKTSDSGTITLVGAGGSSTSSAYGVVVQNAGTSISTVDGLLSLSGSGSGSGSFPEGVFVGNSAVVQATGNGGVSLTGTGSPNGTSGLGVNVFNGGTVSVSNGPLNIVGIGQGSAGTNIGVNVEGATVQSTGMGTISLQGTAPANTAGISFANTFGSGSGTLTTNTGSVVFQANSINLGAANSVLSTGAASFDFVQLTDVPIVLGGGNVAGSLVFTNTDLAALSGFGTVQIGNMTGVSSPIATAANLTFASNLVIGTASGQTSPITITNAINVGTHALTVGSGGPVAVNTGGSLTATGSGTITVTGKALGGTLGNNPAVTIAGSVTAVDGAITLTGTGAGSGGSNYGVNVLGTGLVQAAGAGNVTLTGTGGTGSFSPGIELEGDLASGANPVTLVSTNSGLLTLNGTGAGYGVSLERRGAVRATGTGNLVVTGGSNGITLSPFGNPGVLSVDGGNATLTGGVIKVPDVSAVQELGSGTFAFNGVGLTLSGSTATLNGNSSGGDTFTFVAGSTSDTLTFDNTTLGALTSEVATVKFVGSGGRDIATLTGRGNDTATITPGVLQMAGSGYSVEVDNFAVAYANSSGSGSTATFTLGAGDVFIGRFDYSEMVQAHNAYYLNAIGFAQTTGTAVAGSGSQAWMATSANAGDTLVGSVNGVTIQGTNYKSTANNFGFVAAFAGNINSSTATLSTTNNAGDVVGGVPTYSFVQGTVVSYAIYAVSFSQVTVNASANALAYLGTSTGTNDSYVGTPASSTVRGTGYSIQVLNCGRVQAYGSASQTATLQRASSSDQYNVYANAQEAKGTGYDNFEIGFGNVSHT